LTSPSTIKQLLVPSVLIAIVGFVESLSIGKVWLAALLLPPATRSIDQY
jgi:hypothetical protein